MVGRQVNWYRTQAEILTVNDLLSEGRVMRLRAFLADTR